MSVLRIKHQGQILKEIELSTSQSYLAGRKEDCDIPLMLDKAISREHFRLQFIDEKWNLEVVSRFGEVIFRGEKIKTLVLENGSVFLVPPYEFEVLELAKEAHSEASLSRSLVPTEANEERTYVGHSPQIPYIRFLKKSGDEEENLLRLDGGVSWTAGRESTCPIHIDDQRVSRRQFEIRQTGSTFTILDLGSVNGTLVNGQSISSSDPTLLRSGDAISVLDNVMYFELHDVKFSERIGKVDFEKINSLVPQEQAEVPAWSASQMPVAQGPFDSQVPGPYHPHEHGSLAMNYDPYSVPQPAAPLTWKEKIAQFDYRAHKIQILIGLLVVVLVGGLLFQNDDGGSSTGKTAKGSSQDPFNKLDNEKQILVKQSFQLAQNYLDAQNAELCKTELTRIKDILPEYKKSFLGKDMEKLEQKAEQLIYLRARLLEEEEKQKRQAEAEQKINEVTELCKKKINPQMTADEMNQCLGPAIMLNPQHPNLLALQDQVKQLEDLRRVQDEQRKDQAEQVAKLRRLFNRAEQTERSGRLLEAIDEYEKVISAQLPDPNSLKSKARRSLATIKSQIGTKTSSLVAESDRQASNKNFKAAILQLRKARTINPVDEQIPEKIDSYVKQLRAEMKLLWDEAVIEESFGKIEEAMAKWKKILEQDVSDGEFFQKSKIKLKKYGS